MICISDLAIDRLLAGVMSDVDGAAARAHAARCSRCGALLAEALAEKRAFEARPPRLRLPRALRSYAVAVSAAAALAAFALWPRGANIDRGTRTKGGAFLGFFVSHAGSVRRGMTGEPVVPGDVLELVTSSTEAGWVAVTSIDGAGTRSVYIAPRPIGAGHEQLLPIAIVLDATLGEELVTAVLCREPFALAAIPDDCQTDHFTLAKAPR